MKRWLTALLILLVPLAAEAGSTVKRGPTTPTVTKLLDDAACAGGQVIRRNAGDTQFECFAVAGTGDVQGGATSLDNAIPLYNGAGGKTIKYVAPAWKVSSGELQKAISFFNGRTGLIAFPETEEGGNAAMAGNGLGFKFGVAPALRGYPTGIATDTIFGISHGYSTVTAVATQFAPAWIEAYEGDWKPSAGDPNLPQQYERYTTMKRAQHTVPLTTRTGFSVDERIAVLNPATNVVRATGVMITTGAGAGNATVAWTGWNNQGDPQNADAFVTDSFSTTSNGTANFQAGENIYVFANNCAGSVGATYDTALAVGFVESVSGGFPTQTIHFLPTQGDRDDFAIGKCVKNVGGTGATADLGAMSVTDATTISGALTNTAVDWRGPYESYIQEIPQLAEVKLTSSLTQYNNQRPAFHAFVINQADERTATSHLDGVGILSQFGPTGSGFPVPDVSHAAFIGDTNQGQQVQLWGGIDWYQAGSTANHIVMTAPGAVTGTRTQTLQDATGSVSVTIVSSTSTLGNTLIGSGACASTVTTAAAGAATTDVIAWAYATAPTAADGKLILNAYPTANNVNFILCNPTAGGLTPTGLVVNWRVIR